MTDELGARQAALAARRRSPAPNKRTHAAAGGRVLAVGLSTGGALLLTGFMVRVPDQTATVPPAPVAAPVAPGTPPTTAPATRAASASSTTAGPTTVPAPVVAAAPAPLPPATTSRAS